MCARHFRTIKRIFSKTWPGSVVPALATAALFATFTLGCRSVVENNGIPSTLVLSVNTSVIGAGGESIQVEASLLSTADKPVTGIDVAFVADSGTFIPGAVVATNDQGIAAVTLQTFGAGSLQASVLEGLIQSNVIRLSSVAPPVTLSITFASGEPTAETGALITVRAEGGGTAEVTGQLTVDFGDQSSPGVFPDFSRELIVSHAWAAPGDYEISAVLDLSNGLQVNGMTTASVGEPTAAAIILSTVRFLHTDVSGWPVTSEITGVEISEQLICMFHTKANVWPGIDIPASGGSGPLYGNPWVFANIGGTWYAGTFEWMRPGQQCKSLSPGEYGGNLADRMGPHIKVEPLASWKPKKGEIVGLMYSTLARDGNRTRNERSNVVLVEWPF